MSDILRASGLSTGYDGRDVVHDVSFDVAGGEIVCILGPNGCGKTTLLRAVAGLLPASGEIKLNQQPLRQLKRKDVASQVALLSQLTGVYFAFTVYDTVMLGRYAHQRGAFHAASQADRDSVSRCLHTLGLWELKDRMIDTLSGGQLQRVYLARTLAQDPSLILLDEPTNHLDLRHQVSLMETLRDWTRSTRHAVIGVLHDVNLALSFADRLLLMCDGRIVAAGPPADTLTPALLERVYGMDITAYMKHALSRWEAIHE